MARARPLASLGDRRRRADDRSAAARRSLVFDSTSIAFAAGGAFVAGLVALARRAASSPS
jgi:hypothetical protein